jgi:uncharacterized RDD family membrane protein YckC
MTEIEEILENEENEKVYNFDRLLQLTTWAKIVSWILIVIGVVLVALVLFIIVTGFMESGMPDAYNMLTLLALLGIGFLPVFLGLILQFFIEGSFLLVDIEQNTAGEKA